MPVTLYLAQSVDGFIARSNDTTCWSEDEWKSFADYCCRCGNLVVGRRTFEIMSEERDFERLPKINVVVVSEKKPPSSHSHSAWMRSPKAAIDYLVATGFSNVLVGGGRQLANSCIQAKLVDEIVIDVEPVLFGSGVSLAGSLLNEQRLTLLDFRPVGSGCVQLHYKVC